MPSPAFPFFVLNTKCTARPTAAQPSMIKIVLMLVNAATKKAAAAMMYDRGDLGHSLYIVASARIMRKNTKIFLFIEMTII